MDDQYEPTSPIPQVYRTLQLLIDMQLPLICEQLETLANVSERAVAHAKDGATTSGGMYV